MRHMRATESFIGFLPFFSMTLPCLRACRRRPGAVWPWFSVLSLELVLSVSNGFGKQNELCFFQPLFELFTPPCCPLLPPPVLFPPSLPFLCLFLLFVNVSPQTPGVCSCPPVRPSVCLSSSLPRLSLWQTCAITRTLSIIARLSIKGVISPQCPMQWQGWAPRPRCRPSPAELAPSATCTTASSARPVRRPSRGSR